MSAPTMSSVPTTTDITNLARLLTRTLHPTQSAALTPQSIHFDPLFKSELEGYLSSTPAPALHDIKQIISLCKNVDKEAGVIEIQSGRKLRIVSNWCVGVWIEEMKKGVRGLGEIFREDEEGLNWWCLTREEDRERKRVERVGGRGTVRANDRDRG